MLTEHRLVIHCRCPKDDRLDEYTLYVLAPGMIFVEDILSAVATLTVKPTFQEQLTEQLASTLKAGVITVGYHSGVKTKCTAGIGTSSECVSLALSSPDTSPTSSGLAS